MFRDRRFLWHILPYRSPASLYPSNRSIPCGRYMIPSLWCFVHRYRRFHCREVCRKIHLPERRDDRHRECIGKSCRGGRLRIASLLLPFRLRCARGRKPIYDRYVRWQVRYALLFSVWHSSLSKRLRRNCRLRAKRRRRILVLIVCRRDTNRWILLRNLCWICRKYRRSVFGRNKFCKQRVPTRMPDRDDKGCYRSWLFPGYSKSWFWDVCFVCYFCRKFSCRRIPETDNDRLLLLYPIR